MVQGGGANPPTSLPRVVARALLCAGAMRMWIAIGLCAAGGCAMLQHGGDRPGVPSDEEYEEHCTHEGYKASQKTDLLCDALTHWRYDRYHPKMPPALTRAYLIATANDAVRSSDVSGDDARPELPWAYDQTLDLDLDQVAADLQTEQIDPIVAKRFVADVRDRAKAIADAAAAQPQAWRDVYIKPIIDTRVAWQKAEQRRAPWLARAQKLIDRHDELAVSGKTDAKLAGEMIALQRAYVADCEKAGVAVEECLGDDVARPLTRRIVHLAVLAGDGALTGGEDVLFQVPDRSTRAHAIRLAAQAAVDALRDDRAAWQKAIDSGASDAMIHKRWPTEPIEIESSLTLGGESPDDGEDWLGVDRGQVHDGTEHRIQVARVERRGDSAVLYALKNVRTGEEGTGCYETNKPESISDDGVINYREECTGSRTVSHDETPKPITVPWIEAAKIRPMDVVLASTDDKRRGHVETVRAGETDTPKGEISSYSAPTTPMLQLGEFRLDGGDAKKPVAKAARRSK